MSKCLCTVGTCICTTDPARPGTCPECGGEHCYMCHGLLHALIVVTEEDLTDIAIEVIAEVVMPKNHDYGDAWQKQGMPGVMARLADKLYRVDTLLGKDALVVGEGIEESLVDTIGYSLLGLLYLRRKEHVSKQEHG